MSAPDEDQAARDGAGSPRYAVYFAPERDSALHAFGSRWLGRDAETGQLLDQAAIPGIAPARQAEITAFPRRYGFHATLKAPFRLADGCDEAALLAAVGDLVAARQAFSAPRLRAAELGGWRALVLTAPCPMMQALCDELVAGLDHLRAAPSPAEVERRLAGSLGARETALFRRWGYPHVFDAFKFHMTLTSPLADREGESVDRALAPLVAAFEAEPLAVGAVAVFVQEEAGAPFLLRHRVRFPG